MKFKLKNLISKFINTIFLNQKSYKLGNKTAIPIQIKARQKQEK